MWMCLHCKPLHWRDGSRADIDTHMWTVHARVSWPFIELVDHLGNRLGHDGALVIAGGRPVPGRVRVGHPGRMATRVDAWLVDQSVTPPPPRRQPHALAATFAAGRAVAA